MPSATRNSTAKPTVPTSAPAPARAARQSAAKPVTKPVAATQALAAMPGKASSVAKPERLKMVRDSFTMPKPDFELIGTLKERALVMGREVKKSELLRAGLRSLAALPGPGFLSAVEAVPRLKTGRPHQKK